MTFTIPIIGEVTFDDVHKSLTDKSQAIAKPSSQPTTGSSNNFLFQDLTVDSVDSFRTVYVSAIFVRTAYVREIELSPLFIERCRFRSPQHTAETQQHSSKLAYCLLLAIFVSSIDRLIRLELVHASYQLPTRLDVIEQ